MERYFKDYSRFSAKHAGGVYCYGLFGSGALFQQALLLGHRRGRHAYDHIIDRREKNNDKKDKERQARPAIEEKDDYGARCERNKRVCLHKGESGFEHFSQIHLFSCSISILPQTGGKCTGSLPVLNADGRRAEALKFEAALGYNIKWEGKGLNIFFYETSA
jgi:hypothetical protein